MSATGSGRINGKYTSSGYESPTGGDIGTQRPTNVVEITSHLRTPSETQTPEYIEPQKLYEYFSSDTGQFVVDAPLGIISKSLAASLQRLRQAVQESDELEKENHVALAWSNLFGLARYLGMWAPFDEALALLFSAFESHRSAPYDTKDLVALQKVLEMLRRNPLPTDAEISLVYDCLDAVNFDLNAAFSAVDLAESAEEK